MAMNAPIPHYTLILERLYVLTPNMWSLDKVTIKNLGVPIIIEIHVHQVPTRKDNIQFLLLNETNYAIFARNKKAMSNPSVRLGERNPSVDPYDYILDNLVITDQSFYLPTEKGTVYLILDNSHSTITDKTVTIRVHKQLPSFGSYEQVKEELGKRGWTEVIRHLENVEDDIKNPKKLEGCYTSLRVALGTVIVNAIESLEGGEFKIDEGQSFPINDAVSTLEKNGVPHDIGGLLKRHWALVSEGLHSEKKRGQPPSPRDINYVSALVLDSIRYLISLKSEV